MCRRLNLHGCRAVAQAAKKLACVAAALYYMLSMCRCNVGFVFMSWHALECRRQLLERVHTRARALQGTWQSAQPSCSGPSPMGTEPAKVIQLILEALKKEEACL